MHSVESRSALDQNTSWVYRRIPPVKIYSNQEFSQLPEFLRNEQVVPDGFKKKVCTKVLEDLHEVLGFFSIENLVINNLKRERPRAKDVELNKQTRRRKSSSPSWKATRARNKRAVTIPTLWVKPSSCARGFHRPVIVICFLNSAHKQNLACTSQWHRRSVAFLIVCILRRS